MLPGALAQVAHNADRILLWCVVLLGAVVVLFGGLWYYRRWWLQIGRQEEDTGTPWTLDDLRRMREKGLVNEDEYQALRASMIAAFRGGKSSESTAGQSPGSKPASSVCDDFELRKQSEG